MKEDDLKNLLKTADRMAGPPSHSQLDIAAVRRRANQRRLIRLVGSVATAAVLLIALGILLSVNRDSNKNGEQEKIIALEEKIDQLQVSTDAAVAMIHQVLEAERIRSRIDKLETEYASIPPDPLEEIEKQVDKAAFILVYQADRLYRELNETESAVETYKRVIKLFPENQWAAVARQRLSEIESRSI